jgi:hypothetical protein
MRLPANVPSDVSGLIMIAARFVPGAGRTFILLILLILLILIISPSPFCVDCYP